jgi:hypothetical protein
VKRRDPVKIEKLYQKLFNNLFWLKLFQNGPITPEKFRPKNFQANILQFGRISSQINTILAERW